MNLGQLIGEKFKGSSYDKGCFYFLPLTGDEERRITSHLHDRFRAAGVEASFLNRGPIGKDNGEIQLNVYFDPMTKRELTKPAFDAISLEGMLAKREYGLKPLEPSVLVIS